MPMPGGKVSVFTAWVEKEWRFILATFAASGIGYLGSVAAPFIIKALIDSGFSYEQAGSFGTIELTTLAVGTLILAPLVPHVSHRKLAFSGLLVAMLGVVILGTSDQYVTIAIGRVIKGMGSAMAISGANAAVAARADAERIFAIIWTMGGAVTAALAANLPPVVAGGNYAGAYAVLFVLSVFAAPLILWMPARPKALDADAAARVAQQAAKQGRLGVYGPMALLVLAAIFIYSVAEQMLWQFSYDLAVGDGFDENMVGKILGLTGLMGLLGGFVAAWIGMRLGRVIPIVVGSLLSLAGRWAYMSGGSVGMLWLGGLLWGLGFYFVSPYQVGLAAALDRQGRIAVATAGAMNFGYGFGPGLAGLIRQYEIDHHLDKSFFILSVVGLTVLSLLMLLPVAVRLDRGSRTPEFVEEPAQQPIA
jgi:MFS transporter, DHA1 family, inner membrane transport protein